MRRRIAEETKDVEAAVNDKEGRTVLQSVTNIDPTRLIPTASTMLNLALSDDPHGGFLLGTINNIIGDSAGGKTALMWAIFAEAVYNQRFEKYDLVYDEPESSLEFDIDRLFGEAVGKRVKTDVTSESVEGFHDNVLARAEGKVPFIYGLDSLDSICTEEEIDRDVRKGSYQMMKPKLIGEILRKIVQKVKGSDSTVFIISQTRDAIGVMFGDKKTRSGGKALKFFSSHELWMAVKGHIKRKERDVGVLVRVKVGKNKLTGKLRIVEFPIYYDYGIDDTASCINFLLEEGRWSKKPKVGTINTKGDFDAEDLKEEELITYIEENDLKEKLVEVTAELWNEIEHSISTKRIPKYSDRG
jgi:recombination protein RecA